MRRKCQPSNKSELYSAFRRCLSLLSTILLSQFAFEGFAKEAHNLLEMGNPNLEDMASSYYPGLTIELTDRDFQSFLNRSKDLERVSHTEQCFFDDLFNNTVKKMIAKAGRTELSGMNPPEVVFDSALDAAARVLGYYFGLGSKETGESEIANVLEIKTSVAHLMFGGSAYRRTSTANLHHFGKNVFFLKPNEYNTRLLTARIEAYLQKFAPVQLNYANKNFVLQISKEKAKEKAQLLVFQASINAIVIEKREKNRLTQDENVFAYFHELSHLMKSSLSKANIMKLSDLFVTEITKKRRVEIVEDEEVHEDYSELLAFAKNNVFSIKSLYIEYLNSLLVAHPNTKSCVIEQYIHELEVLRFAEVKERIKCVSRKIDSRKLERLEEEFSIRKSKFIKASRKVEKSGSFILTQELEADILGQSMFEMVYKRQLNYIAVFRSLLLGSELPKDIHRCENMIRSQFKSIRPKFNLRNHDQPYYDACMRIYLLHKNSAF